MEFIKRKWGLKCYEFWFADDPELLYQNAKEDGADIVTFKEARLPWDSMQAAFYNGVIDLGATEEEIFQRFDKKFRYEAKRAEREGIDVSCIKDNSWVKYEKAFNDYKAFSEKKGLKFIPQAVLETYASSGALVMTGAMHSGKMMQHHLYMMGQKDMILLASFPTIESEGTDRKIIGWANRRLHWEDMRWFRQRGGERYNLGGIGNPGSANNENIIRFKQEMTPDSAAYYNGTFYVSIRARIAYKAAKFMRRLRTSG